MATSTTPCRLLLALFLITACVCIIIDAQHSPAGSSNDHQDGSMMNVCYNGGIQTMLTFYDPLVADTFVGTGWWNSANIYTTLLLAADQQLSHTKNDTLAQTLLSSMLPNALNGFLVGLEVACMIDVGGTHCSLDDIQWWALAWLQAYDLALKVGAPVQQAQSFLSAAEKVHSTVLSVGWDDTCGGGTWWSSRHKYKNAITNELLMQLSAGLAKRISSSSGAKYLSWALKEHDWFFASGMINSQHLINDGLTIAGQRCSNNNGTTWTYNQGVVLAALADLFELTGNAAYLRQAVVLVNASLVSSQLTTPTTSYGLVMCEPCSPNCNGDGCQFKGIFVRAVNQLRNTILLAGKDAPPQFVAFANTTLRSAVLRNAESLCHLAASINSTSGAVYFGAEWTRPPPQKKSDGSNVACAQGSGLDAMVAWKSLR